MVVAQINLEEPSARDQLANVALETLSGRAYGMPATVGTV